MRLMASRQLLVAALLGDTPVEDVLRNVEPCEVGSYAPPGCDPFSCCDDLSRPIQSGVCGTFAAEGVRWWVSATVVDGRVTSFGAAPTRWAALEEAPVASRPTRDGGSLVRLADGAVAGLDPSGRVDWLYATRPELAAPHAACSRLRPEPPVGRILDGEVLPGPRREAGRYHLITP